MEKHSQKSELSQLDRFGKLLLTIVITSTRKRYNNQNFHLINNELYWIIVINKNTFDSPFFFDPVSERLDAQTLSCMVPAHEKRNA